MNDKIKNSIDKIEPERGAKERMYQNILKKAAKPETPKVSPMKTVKIALPIAACFCIVLLGIAKFSEKAVLPDNPNSTVDTLPGDESAETPDNSIVLGSNPITDVEDASAFAALGIAVDAPENAEEKTYAIIGGEIAEIRFCLDGHSYRLRASESEDSSGVNGDIVSRDPIENGSDAEIMTLDVIGTGECRMVLWKADTVYFSLFNSDGAENDELRAVYEKIK